MRFTDYYQTLGVDSAATAEDIKVAYRKLARKYHPDVSKAPEAEKRFTELGEANEVLKDPKRRAAFDALRAGGWRNGQEIDAPPAAGDFQGFRGNGFASGDEAHFSEFFSTLFGSRPADARRGFRERGEDITYALAVTLEESFRGGRREISVQMPRLDGHGGVEIGHQSITVNIPVGVIGGGKLRLRGQGGPGSDASSAGDLYLEIGLAPHRLYRVDGRDLTITLAVAPWEAVLGAQVEVPTLGGPVTASIPPGAQSGQKLRLRARGIPGDPPGDQYLLLNIVVPPTASDTVKKLYRELATASAFNPRPDSGS